MMNLLFKTNKLFKINIFFLMLNQTNTYIPFHIVACSSEERGTQIDLLSTQDRASHNSWESSRVSDFPIEIVLRFHYRSELDYCLIATKQDKNIPDIEFHIGDGLAGGFQDVEYRISGYLLFKSKKTD